MPIHQDDPDGQAHVFARSMLATSTDEFARVQLFAVEERVVALHTQAAGPPVPTSGHQDRSQAAIMQVVNVMLVAPGSTRDRVQTKSPYVAGRCNDCKSNRHPHIHATLLP